LCALLVNPLGSVITEAVAHLPSDDVEDDGQDAAGSTSHGSKSDDPEVTFKKQILDTDLTHKQRIELLRLQLQLAEIEKQLRQDEIENERRKMEMQHEN
jgi:hypothetical protein